MYKFFSFVSDGKGKFYYFDARARSNLLKANPENYNPDSHTSIVHKFISKKPASDDTCNKYEFYNGEFIIDQINSSDDSEKARKWMEKFSETKKFEKIAITAVTQNGWTLQYVKKQTPKICLDAVTQNGWALCFVKKQTPEICLAAVTQNGLALEYVKKQTPEICLAAVTQNGWALCYVKKQTPEICLAANKSNLKG